MKAFWWFKDHAIAGMARPGFNAFHWFDLPFDEAMLLGWLGQHSSGDVPLESLRAHLRKYPQKLFAYYGLDDAACAREVARFSDPSELRKILSAFAQRTGVIRGFAIENDRLSFETNAEQLAAEVAQLKRNGIRHVVTLTERHHQRDELAQHFAVHHISIEDLCAPSLEQVQHLADVVRETQKRNEALAAHCLAGIGRTSTMLLGAHMLLGESPAELKALIAKRNPSFTYAGSQGDFLDALAQTSRV